MFLKISPKIIGDICEFSQTSFSLEMNYLGFMWPLRDGFSSGELKSASNEHHIDSQRLGF